MAKQYKKLRNRIHPKKKEPPAPQEKVGKDYLLLVVIGFTALVLLVGWPRMKPLSAAMYLLLLVSLGLTYLRRHGKIEERHLALADKASMGAIGIAVALFVVQLYQEFLGA